MSLVLAGRQNCLELTECTNRTRHYAEKPVKQGLKRLIKPDSGGGCMAANRPAKPTDELLELRQQAEEQVR